MWIDPGFAAFFDIDVASLDTPGPCRCLNQEGNDNDFGEFDKCASGPNVR